MMRVTTNGSLMGYRSSLMKASNNMNSARTKVLTQRNFNSYAEDPAAATQAFQLRRAFSRNSDQLTTVKSLTKKFQSAWDCMGTVKSDLTEKMGKVSSVMGNSDNAGAGRQPLGSVLKAAAESVVQVMNTKYGETFIFAGNDGLNVPFSVGSNGEILFRGVPVDSGSTTGLPSGTPPDPATVTAGSAWDTYYTNNADFAKLAKMSYETAYMDVGSGLKEVGGELVTASAFDSALSGLDMLGFGVDEDGDPKNVASILNRMGQIFQDCDPDSGAFKSDDDEAEASRLGDKLEAALGTITNKWTDLDGQSNYLDSTEERLTSMSTNLNEQILGIEQMDLADALTEFSWAQYCYNAALKVGNSILSQSLIDYMN